MYRMQESHLECTWKIHKNLSLIIGNWTTKIPLPSQNASDLPSPPFEVSTRDKIVWDDIRINHKMYAMRDYKLEFERIQDETLEAFKLWFDGVWFCVSYVLFLSKLSSNIPSTN